MFRRMSVVGHPCVLALRVSLILPVSITPALRLLLDVLLRLLPTCGPAAVHLRGRTVRFSGASESAVTLSDVSSLLGQLVFVDEAALLLAGQFWVGPRLFLSRRKEAVEDHAPIMYQ